MGTRGGWGFVLDQEERSTYVHSDAYPSHLGLIVLGFARQRVDRDRDFDLLRDQVTHLRMVEPTDAIDEHDRAAWSEMSKSDTADDWYELLHDLQEDPARTMELGIMVVSSSGAVREDFTYLIDLDAEVFRVFKWSDEVAVWPLKNLPDDEEMLALD